MTTPQNKPKMRIHWLLYVIPIIGLPVALIFFPWKEMLTSPLAESTKPAEEIEPAVPTLPSDTTRGAEPTAHLDALKRAVINVNAAQQLTIQAQTAFKSNDSETTRVKLEGAQKLVQQVFSDIRSGVGGDFDLGELPKTNPLRTVGSARHALAAARKSVHGALNGSASRNEAENVQALLQDAIDNMNGASAKLAKAIQRLEATH